jgi:nucleoside-diphosphate-sugar epimerase
MKEVMVDMGYTAAIELHPEMPTGPMNRVADDSLARRLVGWEPKVPFVEGLHRVIDWYFSTKDPEEIARRLDHGLTER